MKWNSHRQFLLGTFLGLALTGVLTSLYVSADRGEVSESVGERRSIATVNALAELVSATRAVGGDVGEVLERFTADHEDVLGARIVDLTNWRLLASTFEEDGAAGALPQPLDFDRPDHRDVYELGERLSSAVRTNRRQKSREEIAVDRLEDGRSRLAAPMEYGGHVPGVVIAVVRGEPARLGFVSWRLWLVLAVGMALLFALGRRLRGSGRKLLVVGSVVTLLTLAATVFASLEDLLAMRIAAEKNVAARIQADLERAREVGEVDESLRPHRWDTDLLRQPYETVSADGTVDVERVRRSAGEIREEFRGRFLMAALMGLGIAAALGLRDRRSR